MKKWIIIILIITIMTGCNKSITLNINNNVTNIIYDGVNFIDNDYETIIKEINDKIFYELIDKSITGKNLEIKTNEIIYNFEIVNNYILYTVDNVKYFAKSDNLSKFLNNTVEKYKNDDFFTVEIVNNYDINKSDYLINIDNSDKYIIINSKLNIYDFKINNIFDDNDIYVNEKLINTVDKIESNKIICINTNNPYLLNISFTTPYNYKVNIYYDGKFKKKMIQLDN